jgi:hypothetical protein
MKKHLLLANRFLRWPNYPIGEESAVTSPGSPDCPDLPGSAISAEKLVGAIGLKAGNPNPVGHIEPLKDFSGLRIDAPQITLITVPGGVPELTVDPGNSGDEAVGLDGAKNGSGFGIDLMDLSIAILAHPKCPFGPGESGVSAGAGSRDSGEDTAGLRIYLLDAILGQLKQVLAIKGSASVRCDIDRAQLLSARRIERVQLVSGREPDVLAVKRHSMHAVDSWKWTILADNFGC